jgi:glutamyl-tRNA(Gln) amidotransferase subunit D
MAKKKAKITTTKSIYGNYVNWLQDKFKELDVIPGDEIHIIQGSKDIAGNLLAQNDLGNPQSILIKLDNGYNVGIKVTKSVKLEKLSGSVDLEKFQVRVPEQKINLPQISLLATGGTIASRIDYATGGVVMAMQPEEIFASLPELFDEVSFKSVKSLFSMGSEDLASNEWRTIATNAVEELQNGVDGVVISHGTDTMGYSAAALSFMIRDINAPVVFTGAQRSSDRGSFDGASNLIAASRSAGKADIASVMVAMHESSNDNYIQLTRGTRVRKNHTTRRDAFQAIGEQPFARVDNDGKISEIHFDLPRRNDLEPHANTNYDDNAALVKIYPGIPPGILDFYIDRGSKGIIIEGTGLGHVTTFPSEGQESRNFMSAIERAIDDDIFIGMTSQCIYGRVHPYVYRATRTGYMAGITYLSDMISETALVKLGWVLGNYQNTDDVKEHMLTNYAGEITRSSFYQRRND